MSLAVLYSRALTGMEAPLVTVEVHLANGLPNFTIVGLPETEVKESKDRVRAALLNARFECPARRITVNLAPAELPKESGRFDLPIAIGILVASGQIPGDKLKLYVRIEDGRVLDVAFQGSGCAISKASASIMTDAVKGKTLTEAETLYGQFHELLTGPPDVKADGAGLGKLAVFSGVREFPARVKCATLAWHTLESAIKGQQIVAKTE